MEVQISFPEERYPDVKKTHKNRADNVLCIVGSSLEDDIVYIFKN
jgi:hypothetical protein